MKLPRHDLAQVLASKLKSHDDPQAFVQETAAYLLQTNRSGELESLMRDVIALRADEGMVEVIARTTHPLDALSRSDIEARVKEVYPEASDILVTEQHDGSIVGGVRLELPEKQLDLSVRAQLNRFKQLTAAGKE